MVGNKNRVIIFAIVYALLVLLSLLVGLMSEQLAYVIFFLSSVFFSEKVVFEIWKESKPFRQVKYPVENGAANQKEIEQLSGAIVKAFSDRRYSIYVMSRIRQIFVRKISLRQDITVAEAEKLLQTPAALKDLGWDKFAHLINGRTFSVRPTRNEMMKALNDILDKLEET